jgi:proline dehydrogenase
MVAVSKNKWMKKQATKFGMTPKGFARRFVAGETLDEAIDAIKKLNEKGIWATLDILGENVTSKEDGEKARDTIFRMFDIIQKSGVTANVSVKLTQLGMDVGTDVCTEIIKQIILHAKNYNNFVRIDMEGSAYTQRTIDSLKYILQNVSNNVGIVLQANIRRTESDVKDIIKLGGRVRLCKGAYLEPASIAYTKKRLVNENYLRCAELLLREGSYPAIATHDVNIITKAKEFAKQYNITPDKFEFQMLYGIRRDLQEQLVTDGYRVRVYVPFGTEWFPYFTRRLGERFGNVWFVVKNILFYK